jgi:hypothetical protein
LSRAASQLSDPSDLEEIDVAGAMEGLAFDLMDEQQRARMTQAVLQGVQSLKNDLAAGKPLEEPVLPGIEEKLDELQSFLRAHLSADGRWASKRPNTPNRHVRRPDARPARSRSRRAGLEGSIAVYSKLFGVEPAKQRPGYANFAIAEPPLKLVLLEGRSGEATRMDHLGVEVAHTDQVTAATRRLEDAGLATFEESDTSCCYALQDKVWVHGPGQELGGLRRQNRRRRSRPEPGWPVAVRSW